MVHPEKLNRLRAAYPNSVAERTLKAFFKGILSKVMALNRQPEIFNDYRNRPLDFIDNELLIRDASSLQFGELKTGVLYTEDLKHIVEQLKNLYLSLYDLDEEETPKHTEEFIIKTYRNLIKEGNGQLFATKKITENVQIGDYTFPFAWQNGTYNVVNPVSLDLKRPESIIRKATLNFGKITILESDIRQENTHFDVLLAKPKQRALIKPYEEAINILSKLKTARIWQEDQIEEYSNKTLKALL